MHKLYEMCCERRFIGCSVEKKETLPYRTLYKYLVIPKESSSQPLLQTEQPNSSNDQEQRTPNRFFPPTTHEPAPYSLNNQQPPEIKRRISRHSSHTNYEPRSRSETLPFLEQTEVSQLLSTMSSRKDSRSITHVSRPARFEEQDDEEEEEAQL